MVSKRRGRPQPPPDCWEGGVPPPLVYVSAWRGQGAAGRQLCDVGDDGSGARNSIWGVEAGAAVGRGRSLPSKECEHVWHQGSTCPTWARAVPTHRVGAGAVDVLQRVLPAVLWQGVCRAAVVQHQGAAGKGGVSCLPAGGTQDTANETEAAQGPEQRARHPQRLTSFSSAPGPG